MLSSALVTRTPFSSLLSFRTGWLLPLGFLALGCPSGADLENPEDWQDTACDPTTQFPSEPGSTDSLFEARCGGSICHSPSSTGAPPSGGTDLSGTSAEVAARLYNKPPVASDCASSGALLIDSANPDASLMLLKLHDEQSCGDGMPSPYIDSNKLPDEDLGCIDSWVRRIAAEGAGSSGTGGSGTGGSGAADASLGTGGGS